MMSKSAARVAIGASLILAGGIALAAREPAPRDFVSDHLAGPMVKVHGSGHYRNMKILFLGDGFTGDDQSMGAYRAAVDSAVAQLMSIEPFQALAAAITVYRLDVISDEAGIDVPATCGTHQYDPSPLPFTWARSAKSKQNAIETHWCADSLVFGDNQPDYLSSDGVRLAEFVQFSGITPDITVVLVNDWMFGATTWADDGIVYLSISENRPEVADINPQTSNLLTPNDPLGFPGPIAHEIGHSRPFFLLDEYSNGRPAGEFPARQAEINDGPNLTTVVSPLKWQNLSSHTPAHNVNCPSPDVGKISGGYGFDAGVGVFHSSCDCLMNVWFEQPFCIVCRNQVVKQLSGRLPRPFDEVPHNEPLPFWVLLDSVEVQGLPSGVYTMQYVLLSDLDRVAGAWPPRSGGAPAGAVLASSRPLLVGDVLGVVKSSAQSSVISFEYSLYWQPTSNMTTPATLQANETIRIPLDGNFAGIVVSNRPTHRITLAVFAPR